MRLAAYTDYVYKQRGERIYAQRAFALFLARLGDEVESLAITGRLDPTPGESHYPLPDDIEFVPLPHYASLARPFTALPAVFLTMHLAWGSGYVVSAFRFGPPVAAVARALGLPGGRA